MHLQCFATSPNTHTHLLTPLDNYVPGNTVTSKSAPSDVWPPVSKNQDAAALPTFSTKTELSNLTPPKSNLPLTIPFLAHANFQADTQRWLAKLLTQNKHFAIPLHLATRRIREAAHPTLRSRLHNHRRWEDHIGNPPQVDQIRCGCSHLQHLLLPDRTPRPDEHLMVTLADLQLPTHLRRYLNANMNSTFFPTKQHYCDTFRRNLTKWLRPHGLPTTLAHHADSFLTTHWNNHQQHLQHEDRFTARSIKQLQEFLGDTVVLHHADHELQHLRIFCPQIYFRGCLATWQSPEHFQPLPDDTDQTISNIIQQAYRTLAQKYKWGFITKFNMPYGVVHLKAKKQWKKGHTIISYFKSHYGPLLRVTSNVGQLSIPQLWHHFHDYLQHTPDCVDLYTVNDDLVGGFFNSVPQDRLVQAVQSLVNRWQHTFATPTITVDTHTTGDPIQLAHIGRHHHKHPTQRTLDTDDITTIVALALDSCIFKACNLYFLQVCGARIDSQHSPALCNVAITLIEHSWHQLHHSLTDHTEIHFVYYHYVDNRFVAFNLTFLKHIAIQTLIHPDFYGNPVELEPVDDMHLLGFDVDLHQRTITYIPPDAPWKIRDHASAGSTRLGLSGFHSRAHLIRKYTYPSSAIERALAQLADLYVQKGHDLHSCRQALRKKLTLRAPSPQGVSSTLPYTECADYGPLCVCVSTPVSKDFHFSLYDYFNLCAFRPHNTILHSSRGSLGIRAVSDQRRRCTFLVI